MGGSLVGYLIGIGLVLLILTYTLKYKILEKIRNHIFGFIVYYIIFSSIILIIFKTQNGLESVNDFFTSIILILAILLSFVIFLTNRNIISSSKIIDYINKIPEHIPFSHALKSNLLSLIKVNNKVKVLLRTPDNKNYIWLLNQISAYNSILEKSDIDKNFKDNIEFIFLDNDTQSVKDLFKTFETNRYNYILITSLSKLFKDTIEIRESIEDKDRIKIIGALSSISDEKINNIINNDDNIVRVFPPDYDEANTAMNFIFSRIINTICISKKCDYYNTKSNVIVLHNGTYGRALKDKCIQMFDSEKAGLKYFTNSSITDEMLQNNINFYSFNFTNTGEFVMDGELDISFEEQIRGLSNQENYYYLTGYEPNISYMLEKLNSVLNKYNNKRSYFLFCGTSTMFSWRKSIVDTINSLKCIKNKEAYYLKLKFYENSETQNSGQTECSLKFIFNNKESDIKTIMENSGITNIDLKEYCSLERNYISLITQQSLEIAKEIIDNPEINLLNAKYKVLQKLNKDVNILVNGDSINQYEIEKMQ